MTPKERFAELAARADIKMNYAEPQRRQYWMGYRQGLGRAYHGSSYRPAGGHGRLMSLVKSDYEPHRQHGQGYRDGLRALEKEAEPTAG